METQPVLSPALSIVVPCYNEADNVEKLRGEFFPVMAELARRMGPVEVIFVDDGSRDGTWEALTGAFGGLVIDGVKVRFEKHVVNRGVGAAQRTGFAAAEGEIVVTTDSDGTYRFAEIPALLACLTPGVSIVTASPYHPQGGVANVPAYRLILSRGSSILYQIVVSPKVHTYTALFRAYRRDVVKSITFEADGFLAGTELMVKAMLEGHKVAEYPTVLHSRQNGVSKARLVRTIRAHLGFLRRVLLYRLGLRSSQISLEFNKG